VVLGAADNPVLNQNLQIGEEEIHAAVLKFTASGGATGSSELRFGVVRVA
jgi:hypothetical protein